MVPLGVELFGADIVCVELVGAEITVDGVVSTPPILFLGGPSFAGFIGDVPSNLVANVAPPTPAAPPKAPAVMASFASGETFEVG